MTADTILTRFRAITTLAVGTYADANVTDKAEPFALAYFNKVMDLSETITTHTTGDLFMDEILTHLCAYFAFEDLYFKRGSGGGGVRKQSDQFMQKALFLMQAMDPSRIKKSTTLEEFYPSYRDKGSPPSEPSIR